jgi:hypothetical protein
MTKNLKMSTLHITLFEKQLVRSYLLSDQGHLIKQLSNVYNINIITSKELEGLISEKSLELGLITSVTVFENYKENILIKILSSIFRYSNKSSVTIQIINLQKQSGSRFFRTLLRYIIYLLVSNSKFLKLMLRKIFQFLVGLQNLRGYFTPFLQIEKIDILFVTSLLPLRGQDIIIGVFFRKRKIRVLGTVRSWDNLSVNGTLPFVPDLFLSHSDYMRRTAVNKQGISKDSIVMSVTPSYQHSFLVDKIQDKTGNINFSYMCQGLVVNPDDRNFVYWLVDAWRKMPKNFNLFIVQHPSFIMEKIDIFPHSNVQFIVFEYSSTSLNDYYSHLSSMDLVFGGGTTGLLDACFLNVPVVVVEFEIEQQEYWQSTLRHFDYFPWTADFFNGSKFTRAKNKNDLINYLINYKDICSIDNDYIVKFTGSPTINMPDEILSASLKLLR